MSRRTNLKLMTDRIRRFEEDEHNEVNKILACTHEGWSVE